MELTQKAINATNAKNRRGQRSEVRSQQEEYAESGLGCSVLDRSPVIGPNAMNTTNAMNATNAINSYGPRPGDLETWRRGDVKTRLRDLEIGRMEIVRLRD